jgi:membrane protein YqaA with SNARE-associated domain
LKKISRLLLKIKTYLIAMGPFGLFAIAFLDSFAIPMPAGVDAALLFLTVSHETGRMSWMLLYVAMATLGSTAGCVGLYLISRRAGHRALNRFSEKKRKRVMELLDKYDVLSVLVASLMPPPFPFKLFVVSAGVFRLSLLRFTLAIAVGRAVRYLLEGYLAVRFGDEAINIVQKYSTPISLGAIALILIVFIAKALIRRARGPEPVSGVEG